MTKIFAFIGVLSVAGGLIAGLAALIAVAILAMAGKEGDANDRPTD